MVFQKEFSRIFETLNQLGVFECIVIPQKTNKTLENQ